MMEGLCFGNVLKDDHIFRMTDDTGIMQHSKYSVPDPNHGYTADDNARALIMALMLYERYGNKKYLDLIYRYSSFILNAQNEKGKFRNFMRYDRKWLEEEGSEDCFGRCMWSLGYAISNNHTPQGIKNGLNYILNNAIPFAASLNSPRAKAYCIMGFVRLENKEAKELAPEMARSLCDQYKNCSGDGWRWFEDIVTYCNHVLPRSLFAVYRATGEKWFFKVARESLEFISSMTFKNGYFKPVGCNGWLPRGGFAAEFDEQPVEACEAVLTYLEAYETTGEKKYLEMATASHAWYIGRNSKGISLVDNETGGCRDGLTMYGANLNMGAESLVSYVISHLAITGACAGVIDQI